MKIPFTKMHGLGNDYIYIDCFKTPVDTLPDPSALSARLSPRRFSVGADGLVLILPSDKATARMRMFNADGSEGLMCGNAIRCVELITESARLNKTVEAVNMLPGREDFII